MQTNKNNVDPEYFSLVKTILEKGTPSNDRTGVGTLSYFGPQMRFDLTKGFPQLTTKRVPFKLIVSELLWFLKGSHNIKFLLENNNHIWDEWGFEKWITSDFDLDTDFKAQTLNHGLNYRFENKIYSKNYDKFMEIYRESILTSHEFANKYGDLGPVYGKQWRDFNGIDQIANIINELKTNPTSRRMIVSAWNPEDVDDMALPPCHTIFQLYVRDGKLSSKLYQRSGDIFLGVPFNISSYALLTHILAKQAGLNVGEFIHTFGDAHIYTNHMTQIKEQLQREPKDLPELADFPLKPVEEYDVSDFNLIGYDPHPAIKGDVAV